MSDESEKTEEPTGKRLGEARGKGNVLQSREVTNLTAFMAILVVVLAIAPRAAGHMTASLSRLLSSAHQYHVDDNEVATIAQSLLLDLGLAIGLAMLLMLAVAVGTSMLQVGLMWNLGAISFNFDRLNPLNGFKRLFSIRSVTELVKGMLKIGIVGAVIVAVLLPDMAQLGNYLTSGVGPMMADIGRMTVKLLMAAILAMLAIAIADYFYQRWEYFKNLKMTKQEVKDEYKQQEGDPAIKGRLRKLRNEKARRRMMAQVPTATVVITNPTHYAVALRYTDDMPAPKLVAKGLDLIAKRIRDVATENFVPIVENPPLARALYTTVELDDLISPDLYRAVAEVISYVTRLKKQAIH